MGIEREEIEAAVKELADEGRKRLAVAPTTDQLWAYARGDLEPEERDRVEELLAHYPESVKELLELEAFPYEGDSSAPDYLTDQELEEDWTALQAHLKIGSASPPTAVPSVLSWAPLAAAVILVVFLSGLTLHERSLARQPLVNAQEWVLQPDDLRKGIGDETAAQLPADTSHYYLILNTVGASVYDDYRVEIRSEGDDQSEPIWSQSGLRRNHDDSFSLWLPRSFLGPGTYRLKLIGVGSEGETPLATYTIQL